MLHWVSRPKSWRRRLVKAEVAGATPVGTANPIAEHSVSVRRRRSERRRCRFDSCLGIQFALAGVPSGQALPGRPGVPVARHAEDVKGGVQFSGTAPPRSLRGPIVQQQDAAPAPRRSGCKSPWVHHFDSSPFPRFGEGSSLRASIGKSRTWGWPRRGAEPLLTCHEQLFRARCRVGSEAGRNPVVLGLGGSIPHAPTILRSPERSAGQAEDVLRSSSPEDERRRTASSYGGQATGSLPGRFGHAAGPPRSKRDRRREASWEFDSPTFLQFDSSCDRARRARRDSLTASRERCGER